MAVVTYYFNAYDVGEAWFYNPENMVDGSIETGDYAHSNGVGDIQLLTGNTCPGENLGKITKIELRAFGWVNIYGFDKVYLKPLFSGGDGSAHDVGSFYNTWSAYVDITSDPNAPGSWDWANVVALDCEVKDYEGTNNYPGVHKVEIRITYSEAGPPFPIGRLRKNAISGYHCFLGGYMSAVREDFDPLKLPDGTVF